MQDKKGISSKRSVTAPNIPKRNRTPSQNEEGAPNLVKVNPYKIARATSFNVFMEYGAPADSDGQDVDPVAEQPPIDDAPKASLSNIQEKIKEPHKGDLVDKIYKAPISEVQTHRNMTFFQGATSAKSFLADPVKQKSRLKDNDFIAPKGFEKEDESLASNQLLTTEVALSPKASGNTNPEISNDVHLLLPRKSKTLPVKIGAEPKLEKRKMALNQGALNLDIDKSSGSLNTNFIDNTGSDFVPNFHIDEKERNQERRDATVIYTKKPDMEHKEEQSHCQGMIGDHSSVNSPVSDSTNRTRTGVKSKYGSDLMSFNLSGQNNIESEEPLSKRVSGSMDYDGEKPTNVKSGNPPTSVSRKSKDHSPSHRKVATITSLSVFGGVILAGLLIAIFILSRGTRDSVNSYFRNGRNIPHLRELVSSYLLQEESFGALTNSVDGLSYATKNDNEVTDLMKGVSNVMFHGIAYSPNKAMEPQCQFSKRDAMLDLAKISTITTRIRTYGMQCDQAELILEAIDHMNLNMTVAMGVWIGKNDTLNKQQMDMMKKVVAKHLDPARVVNSIFIGNEVLFRGDKTKKELIEYIQDAKRFLQVMKIDDIPVGTSEVGSLIDLELLRNCDVVGANIQPFFGGVSVEDATHWMLRFLDLQILPHNENIGTPIVITEIGWPSGGGRYRYAQAGMSSLKIFLSTFLCTMRELPIEYYFFEAYDEPWKEIFWTGNQKWETQWGIFNADRLNKFALQNIGCI